MLVYYFPSAPFRVLHLVQARRACSFACLQSGRRVVLSGWLLVLGAFFSGVFCFDSFFVVS
jgi:hypothetical protein